ncbi:MAG: hypothetical protein GY748_26015 [Planctomycetaceae bacterium]|nr:hypothetical protein [Planctomycetaceae bacterium]
MTTIQPAAMNQKDAAVYCGLSVDLFIRVCPVKPIRFTLSTKGERYLKIRLDEWLENEDPNPKKREFHILGDMAGD